MVNKPFLRRISACACVYRHTTSPRVSLWKSQGETTTMSLFRIQTRRFILPRIRHKRSLPSWHFTMMRSKPSSFTTTPKTSPCEGYTISLSCPSLRTFFLPKYCTSGLLVLEEWFTFLKSVIILLCCNRLATSSTSDVFR